MHSERDDRDLYWLFCSLVMLSLHVRWELDIESRPQTNACLARQTLAVIDRLQQQKGSRVAPHPC